MYALSITASAFGYAAAYPTAELRIRLAASLGSNAGLAVLFGPTRRLDMVAGFTAWRTLGTLMIVGPIWALLLATRLTKGEEDAGRWELYLAGSTTRRRATAATCLGLLTGAALVWLITAAVAVLAGRHGDVGWGASAAVFLTCTLVLPAVLFLAVGVFVAQLAADRRQANVLGGLCFAAAFAVRMIADSNLALHWLRWVTPLGWIEQAHPLTGSASLPLMAVATLAALSFGAAIRLSGRRDLGTALWTSDREPRSNPRLLTGPLPFAVRRTRGLAAGWAGGLAALSLLGGLIARTAARGIADNAAVRREMERLGIVHTGAQTYLGVIYLMAAALAAFAAGAMVSALRAEEAQGYLDPLISRPLGRTRWLLGRITVDAGEIVVLALAMGIAGWAGAASQHTGISLPTLVLAGLNAAQGAFFVLGTGVALFGVLPRIAPVASYAVVAWSFVLELIGSTLRLNHWLLDTSVLGHVAPAPAADPR